jgi:hypothetical protein
VYDENVMSMASPAYLEIIDFIAAGTTPEQVARFRPSIETQQRLADLIERAKENGLSPEEKAELDHFHGAGTYPEDGKGASAPDSRRWPVMSAANFAQQ